MAAAASAVAPTHVSHHDASRAAVSTTALGVCALRVWESKKDPSERAWDEIPVAELSLQVVAGPSLSPGCWSLPWGTPKKVGV